MKKSIHASLIAIAFVAFCSSSVFALPTQGVSAGSQDAVKVPIDGGLGCVHPAVSLARGDSQALHAGDKVCVDQADGGSWCGTVDAASTAACANYTCPTNGKVVDDGTSCGDCKSGTGTVADCKTCCDSFYDGADRINCKRNNC